MQHGVGVGGRVSQQIERLLGGLRHDLHPSPLRLADHLLHDRQGSGRAGADHEATASPRGVLLGGKWSMSVGVAEDLGPLLPSLGDRPTVDHDVVVVRDPVDAEGAERVRVESHHSEARPRRRGRQGQGSTSSAWGGPPTAGDRGPFVRVTARARAVRQCDLRLGSPGKRPGPPRRAPATAARIRGKRSPIVLEQVFDCQNLNGDSSPGDAAAGDSAAGDASATVVGRSSIPSAPPPSGFASRSAPP